MPIEDLHTCTTLCSLLTNNTTYTYVYVCWSNYLMHMDMTETTVNLIKKQAVSRDGPSCNNNSILRLFRWISQSPFLYSRMPHTYTTCTSIQGVWSVWTISAKTTACRCFQTISMLESIYTPWQWRFESGRNHTIAQSPSNMTCLQTSLMSPYREQVRS